MSDLAPPIASAHQPTNPSTKPNGSATAAAADDRLRADRDRFVALAFCWADTLIELDADNMIVFAAGMTMAVAGYGPGEMIGRHVDEVLMPESRPAIGKLLGVAEKCGRIDNASITFKGPDGDGVPVDLAAHKLPDLGNQSFLAIRLCAAPAEEPARQSQSLDDDLLDSEAFIGAAKRMLPSKTGKAGAMLTLLSVPEVASLRQGLDATVYRTLATTLAGYLKARSHDRSSAASLADGRYGLIHKADLDVERLESQFLSIVNEFDPSGTGASIESASIAPNPSLTEDTLGQVVVYAIRHFRDAGDTGFTLNDLRVDLPKIAGDATEMAKTFASLVESKAFHIAFQPIACGDGGDILFYEGLARINGRDGASPYRYIAYAEETGQICEFDLAMTQKALTWLESRPEPDIRISINLSGMSMLDPDFITRLHGVLESDPASGARLAFEITDSSRFQDLEAANRFVQSLRQRGHEVGLDDFGTGIGGFRILATMDVDFVKFGREALTAAEDAGIPRALLASLAGFCRMQGIRTIATAVETAESLEALRDCGIACFQGYLLGKPAPDIDLFRSTQAAIAQGPAV